MKKLCDESVPDAVYDFFTSKGLLSDKIVKKVINLDFGVTVVLVGGEEVRFTKNSQNKWIAKFWTGTLAAVEHNGDWISVSAL